MKSISLVVPWLCRHACFTQTAALHPLRSVHCAAACKRHSVLEASASTSQAMVLSNPTDIRLPPVKIGDDVPPSARGVMRSLADLVSQCTAIQPDARPSFAEILEARHSPSARCVGQAGHAG